MSGDEFNPCFTQATFEEVNRQQRDDVKTPQILTVVLEHFQDGGDDVVRVRGVWPAEEVPTIRPATSRSRALIKCFLGVEMDAPGFRIHPKEKDDER
jgi:hypothetical protein